MSFITKLSETGFTNLEAWIFQSLEHKSEVPFLTTKKSILWEIQSFQASLSIQKLYLFKVLAN